MNVLLLVFVLIVIGLCMTGFHKFLAPKLPAWVVWLIDVVVLLCTLAWVINTIFPGSLAGSSGCNTRVPTVAAPTVGARR